MQHQTVLIAASAVALLSAGALPTQAQETTQPSWTQAQRTAADVVLRDIAHGRRAFDPPGLSRSAARHFQTSASYFARLGAYPSFEITAYDPVTRCVTTSRFDASRPRLEGVSGGYVRAPQATTETGAADIAVDSIRTLLAFRDRQAMPDAADCRAALQGVYGDTFDANRRRFAGLTQHSLSVLNGGSAGSAEAPLGGAQLTQTAISREYARRMIRAPEFLAATTTPQRVVIVMGDPGGSVRWATEYANAGEGRWRFVGGTDVGASLLLR